MIIRARIKRGSMVGTGSVRVDVVDANDKAVATITSLQEFMKFRRTWATDRKKRMADVALVVPCEGDACLLLASGSAFRAFAKGERKAVQTCYVVEASALPSGARRELSAEEGENYYECWRRAAGEISGPEAQRSSNPNRDRNGQTDAEPARDLASARCTGAAPPPP